jgi:Tol biopolymer transport system component
MRAIAPIAAGLWACVASLPVATVSDPLVTVAQRDPSRSPRSMRTADISADGRHVVFESRAQLVPADRDEAADIYVLDRATGHVTLESGDVNNDKEYSGARISGDGRRVVFEGRAVGRSPRTDILLRDRSTASTRSLTGDPMTGPVYEWSRSPDISDDGRVVVFSSASTNLTAGADANGPLEDVYAADVMSGAVQRVSLGADGAQRAAGTSIVPSVSADGRWVAFASTAPLDAAMTDRRNMLTTREVFLRDVAGGITIRLTRPGRGALPNGDSSIPSVSGDGRFVAFASEASNLAVGAGQDDDGNRGTDVFLFDRDTASLTRVSRGANGSSANGFSTHPAISGNGRFIAFQSDAGNLACTGQCSQKEKDINLLWDAFVFDRATGRTVRVSEDELGGWMEWSIGISIDAAGRVVAFSSRHPMDTSDRLDDLDLFIRPLSPPALTDRHP